MSHSSINSSSPGGTRSVTDLLNHIDETRAQQLSYEKEQESLQIIHHDDNDGVILTNKEKTVSSSVASAMLRQSMLSGNNNNTAANSSRRHLSDDDDDDNATRYTSSAYTINSTDEEVLSFEETSILDDEDVSPLSLLEKNSLSSRQQLLQGAGRGSSSSRQRTVVDMAVQRQRLLAAQKQKKKKHQYQIKERHRRESGGSSSDTITFSQQQSGMASSRSIQQQRRAAYIPSTIEEQSVSTTTTTTSAKSTNTGNCSNDDFSVSVASTADGNQSSISDDEFSISVASEDLSILEQMLATSNEQNNCSLIPSIAEQRKEAVADQQQQQQQRRRIVMGREAEKRKTTKDKKKGDSTNKWIGLLSGLPSKSSTHGRANEATHGNNNDTSSSFVISQSNAGVTNEETVTHISSNLSPNDEAAKPAGYQSSFDDEGLKKNGNVFSKFFSNEKKAASSAAQPSSSSSSTAMNNYMDTYSYEPPNLENEEDDDEYINAYDENSTLKSSSTRSGPTTCAKRARQLLVDIESGSQAGSLNGRKRLWCDHHQAGEDHGKRQLFTKKRCFVGGILLLLIMSIVGTLIGLDIFTVPTNNNSNEVTESDDAAAALVTDEPQWYADWDQYKCVQNCIGPIPCGGLTTSNLEEAFPTLRRCCEVNFEVYISKDWTVEECIATSSYHGVGMDMTAVQDNDYDDDDATDWPTLSPVKQKKIKTRRPNKAPTIPDFYWGTSDSSSGSTKNEQLYYPDWDNKQCILQDSITKKSWDAGYISYEECCVPNFGWDTDSNCYIAPLLGEDLINKYDDDEKGDTAAAEDTTSASMIYYPDFTIGLCLGELKSSDTRSQHTHTTYATYEMCCNQNFRWDTDSECYDDGGNHGGVTQTVDVDTPASDDHQGGVTYTVDVDTITTNGDDVDNNESDDSSSSSGTTVMVYYPDFVDGLCLGELSTSSLNNRFQHTYTTYDQCCQQNFRWDINSDCYDNGVGYTVDVNVEQKDDTSFPPVINPVAPAPATPTPPVNLNDIMGITSSPVSSAPSTSPPATSLPTPPIKQKYYADFITRKCILKHTSTMQRWDTGYSTESACCMKNFSFDKTSDCYIGASDATTMTSTTAATKTTSSSTSLSTTKTTTSSTSTLTTTAPPPQQEMLYFARFDQGKCMKDTADQGNKWGMGYASETECCYAYFRWDKNSQCYDRSSVADESSTLSCPETLDHSASINSKSTLYYAVVSDPSSSNNFRWNKSSLSGSNNGILCARLEVIDNINGWIGLGFSQDGTMSTSQAIIGIPDEDTVRKYNLSGYHATPMADERQTLRDTSIIVDDMNGKTILTFTKLLIEDDEVHIVENGKNIFLHAWGGSTLGYHAGKLSFSIDFGSQRTFDKVQGIDLASEEPTYVPTSIEPTYSPIVIGIPTKSPVVVPSSFPTSDLTNTPTTKPVDQLEALTVELKVISPLSSEDLDNGSSNQYRAMEWLLDNVNYNSYSSVRKVQRFALATFYRSTSGSDWLDNNGWMEDDDVGDDECTWYGIVCDAVGLVTSITLTQNDLEGEIPAEINLLENLESLILNTNRITSFSSVVFSMVNLKVLDFDKNFIEEILSDISPLGSDSLEQLYLSNNKLTSIPNELFRLRQVKNLWLANNKIASTLPTGIGMMTKLEELDLESNLFEGHIPTELYSLANLHTVYLHDNMLSGSISPLISRMSSLQILDLDTNFISGELPAEIGLLSKLSQLHLGDNAIVGQLPWGDFTMLGSLTELDISENYLNSTIGPEIGSLSNLVHLKLDNNYRLDDDDNLISYGIQGPIPGSIASLTMLEELRLDNNYIGGAIPASIGNMQSLTTIRLESNNLQSSIPSSLGNLSNIQYLHLWSNYIVSSISGQLGKLSQLKELFLDDNELTGTIPPELGQLSSATYISLAENNLSGIIPPTLGMLSSLGRLDLQFNNLFGEVPSQLANSPIGMMKLEGNSLYGSIPDEICEKIDYLSGNCAVDETSESEVVGREWDVAVTQNAPTPSPTLAYWWSCNCCTTCYPGEENE